MKYDVDVLEKMIEIETDNIKSLQDLIEFQNRTSPYYDTTRMEEKLARLVANRRLIAAMIENQGERVIPAGLEKDVYFDVMNYAASVPGADTSWWTKGT